MSNYYNTLNVSETALGEDIKKSYRQLSLKYHPDRNMNDPTACTKFQEISEAYETLGDPDKRKEYDIKRKNPFTKMMSGGGNPMDDIFAQLFGQGIGQGMPFGQEMSFGQGMPFIPGVQVFRNGVPLNMQQGLQKPVPIVKNVTIAIGTVLLGTNIPVEIERWVHEGNLKVYEKETIYIDIPKGIDDNEIIIIKDKGNVLNDNIKGDVKIFIKINNNTDFKRNGLDLLLYKTITLKESLCGFSFELNYLNGKSYTINNSAGNVVPSGFEKIIPNLGFNRNGHVGNLIITFDIIFPVKLSEEALKSIQQIDF
jgi:DnaJ-class molecular chaperone